VNENGAARIAAPFSFSQRIMVPVLLRYRGKGEVMRIAFNDGLTFLPKEHAGLRCREKSRLVGRPAFNLSLALS
jgi:hypothetical protein